MDVTNIKSGRWGISRIIAETKFDGSVEYYAAALRQPGLADVIEAHYPPLVNGQYVIGYALVRLQGNIGTPDADTELFPRLDLDIRMGDLTTAQRDRLRNRLETFLTTYTFTDWDGTVVIKPAFSLTTATYTADTTLRQIARDVFKHLHNSVSRPKPALVESHNTEYVDDFGTDPFAGTPRWVNEVGTAVWDGTNFEMDMSYTNAFGEGVRYDANDPGSIEQEAQSTLRVVLSGGLGGGGAAVRFDSAGTNDWYWVYMQSSELRVMRKNDPSTETQKLAVTHTFTSNSFYTVRIAAEGTAGSNVALSVWIQDEGTSKPTSDPGWIGVDGSPDGTVTDSDATRIDDSDQIDGGLSCAGDGIARDDQQDWFKVRAISDRPAGNTITNTIVGSLLQSPPATPGSFNFFERIKNWSLKPFGV